MTGESNKCGIGIGLKHASQGIAITEGKFSIQVSEILYGGPAEGVKWNGKLRSGDFLLSIDGWSTDEKEISEVAERMLGDKGTEVRITVARLVGPHRFFFQPNVWLQMGVVRFNMTLQRAPVAERYAILSSSEVYSEPFTLYITQSFAEHGCHTLLPLSRYETSRVASSGVSSCPKMWLM